MRCLLIFAIFIFLIDRFESKDLSAIISQSANYKASGEAPIYIDTSSTCPKLYYSTNRVVVNCSSLNLAVNWTVLNIDIPFVTELILSNNNFRTKLPSNEINQFNSLNLLDLSHNFISETTTDLQLIDCRINHFKEFILNGNLFTQVPLLNLNCMSTLERLSMNNNKMLVNLDDPNTFTNSIDGGMRSKTMERLSFLDVSFCNIEQINQNNFTILQYMPRLTYINLYGNRIKYIYQNPFQFTPFLNYLSFEGNNIFCDSYIIWMKEFLTTRKSRSVCCDTEEEPPINPPIIDIINPEGGPGNQNYTPTCFSPLTLNNESILVFPDNLFLIYLQLTTTIVNPNSISVVSEYSLTLDCSVYSRPGADLWWTFNDRVLSKTTSPDSPYEFDENFDSNSSENMLNRTSTLKIKKSSKELAGRYSCKAFYKDYEPNEYLGISTILFQVNVEPNPNPEIVGVPLSAGQIAGIVLGSLFGFLLLCLLIFLCVYCCCFSGSICCLPCCCCCPGGGRKEKKSSFTSNIIRSSNTDLRYSSKPKVTETEENQSGFKDINKIKPNYVINTISKGNNSYERDTEVLPDSSITWKILPNKNLTDTDLNTLHNANNLNLIHSSSNSHVNRQVLNQFNQQQDLIDINLPHDDTMNYNTQSSCNEQYSMKSNVLNKNQHRPQTYSMNNPIDYGSTYNTNEGFLNDNMDINQVRFTTDVIINDNLNEEQFEQYDSFNPNGLNQHYTSTAGANSIYSTNHNNFSSFSKEVNSSEILRTKQYINSNNYNSNYIHEVNNTSFVKYDSDV